MFKADPFLDTLLKIVFTSDPLMRKWENINIDKWPFTVYLDKVCKKLLFFDSMHLIVSPSIFSGISFLIWLFSRRVYTSFDSTCIRIVWSKCSFYSAHRIFLEFILASF